MRYLYFLVILTVTLRIQAQSNRLDYYAHVKTVYANGRIVTLSSDKGQFINRTTTDGGARCYDATYNGRDHLNGTLFYVGKNGANEVYKGKSYWGNKSSYQFDDSRGLLNVKDANGNVYVFKRARVPAGKTRSSYLVSGASADGWNAREEWNKLNQGNDNYNQPSGSETSDRQKRTKHSSSSSRTCGYCHGSKRIRAHVGTGSYGVSNKKQKCSTCGVWYDVSTDHWHACPYCK